MNTTPTPEAVDAAMRLGTSDEQTADQTILWQYRLNYRDYHAKISHRILRAEVERLRADLEECRGFHRETIGRHDACGKESLKLRSENELLVAQIEQLNRAIDNQHKMMSQWLNRRASVEDVLYSVAAGKRGALTPEECRDLARKLGVPEK